MMLLPFLCLIWNLVTVYPQTRCTFLIGKVLTEEIIMKVIARIN